MPASDSGARFRSLLDQIAQQEVVLKEKKEAESKKKAEAADSHRHDRRGGRKGDRRGASATDAAPRTRRTNAAPAVPAGMDMPAPEKAGRGGKKRRGGQQAEHGDHYSRMAREA